MTNPTIGVEAFPLAHSVITERLGDTQMPPEGSVVLFGGSSRNALLEATEGITCPIRDIDLVPIGKGLDDQEFRAIHHKLNPEDTDTDIRVFRFPDVDTLLAENIDFTINGSVIELGNGMQLTTTPEALEAARSRLIQPTMGRIAVTKKLQEGGKETRKRFLRNETGMPARAAYFVAVFRAAGFDFDYDLLDHPTPARPDDAHPFFLGLMINKALSVDETERGPGDITATQLLFELYKEMGPAATDTSSGTVEDIVAFCEAANYAKPALKFHGSEVASLVKHTDRKPEPKTD